MCLKGIKSTVLFHLFIIFHMACDRGMKCSTSLSVEQLHNSSADSLHHYGNQSKTLSFCQAKRSRRPSPCHCQWWLNIGAFFLLCLSNQIRVTLVCRCHRGGVSWRSPTIWRETVMSSSNPRSWSTQSRPPVTTRTCTESCSWTRRG